MTLRAKARQRFGQKAAAAAEIDDAQACQRLFRLAVAWPLAIGEMRTAEVAQIADAHGVELVQGALRPGEIPPAIAELGESREILGIDAAAALSWKFDHGTNLLTNLKSCMRRSVDTIRSPRHV